MERFQVVFFNHAGTVFSEKAIEAEDETSAISYAQRVFNCGIGMGYEIRDALRHLIHREIFG